MWAVVLKVLKVVVVVVVVVVPRRRLTVAVVATRHVRARRPSVSRLGLRGAAAWSDVQFSVVTWCCLVPALRAP
jgi:hypothetical protein